MDNESNTTPKGGGSGKTALIIVVILIILGLAWFAMSKKGGSQSKVESNSQTQSTPQTPITTTMKELQLSGKTQKCEVTFSNDKTTSKGTLYFGNGKMRADFNSTVEGKAMTSHMINDGTSIYTWIDGQNLAVKMSVKATEGSTTEKQQQSLDPNAKYNYDCSSWAADDFILTPPAALKFMDLSTPPSNESGNTASCTACNNAGSGKAQCLAALHCK